MERKRSRVTIRLSEDHWNLVKEEARKRGTTPTKLLKEILLNGVDEALAQVDAAPISRKKVRITLEVSGADYERIKKLRNITGKSIAQLAREFLLVKLR